MDQMMAAADAQFVTVGMDGAVFAVPVELVQEILDRQPVTRIPDAPRHILGLIDVRGRGVAVMDLRTRLGVAPLDESEDTRILVLEVPAVDRPLLLGLQVDRVFEVTALDGAGIGPPPDTGAVGRSESVLGIGRRGGDFVILLDVCRLFREYEPPPPATADC